MSGWVLAAVTLTVGLVIGFLAQRSRMCFVGAIRDWLLAGVRSGLWGIVSFVVTAAVGFAIAAALRPGSPHLQDFPAYRAQLGLTAPSSPPADGSFVMEVEA